MGCGNLLWGREIQRLNNGPKQYIDGCWLWNPGHHAIAQNFHESHIRACGVGQHFGLWLYTVQFIEENQPTKVLDGILVSSCTRTHCFPCGRPQRDENIGDDKRKFVLMQGGDGGFDRCGNRYLCPQGFCDGSLHNFYMFRVVIDE